MYITRDYLKTTGWVGICDLITNHTNKTVIPGSTQLLNFHLTNLRDTVITIKRNGSTEETYNYKRLNLGEFFRATVTVEVPDIQLPMDTYQVMREIGLKNGIVFDLDDFIIEPIMSYDRAYQIKASPKSLRFYGELSIKLSPNLLFDVDTATSKQFPDVYTLTNTNPKKTVGEYYLTGYDFTEHRELLKAMQVDKPKPPSAKLIAAIAKTTTLEFVVSTTPTERNLYVDTVLGIPTYRVVYNGVVLPRYTHRTDIENVLVLNLSPVNCTDIVGQLLIHYN